MRLAGTENRFSQKSFMFDQNLHLLTRKSFYILVLPSNNFRSTRKREKHTQPKHNKTQEVNKRSNRERERSRHRADRRRSRSCLRLFGFDDFFRGFVCVLRNE